VFVMKCASDKAGYSGWRIEPPIGLLDGGERNAGWHDVATIYDVLPTSDPKLFLTSWRFNPRSS